MKRISLAVILLVFVATSAAIKIKRWPFGIIQNSLESLFHLFLLDRFFSVHEEVQPIPYAEHYHEHNSLRNYDHDHSPRSEFDKHSQQNIDDLMDVQDDLEGQSNDVFAQLEAKYDYRPGETDDEVIIYEMNPFRHLGLYKIPSLGGEPPEFKTKKEWVKFHYDINYCDFVDYENIKNPHNWLEQKFIASDYPFRKFVSLTASNFDCFSYCKGVAGSNLRKAQNSTHATFEKSSNEL